ncbi:ABC-F family ATP-binding cassette domain-containing protein [Desulfitobacterium sp.]|uniref:ABC-F family ATP-binding cassette domain-containing protein n=1 Tax=Desulfitobacterium sp. TaxID=49981 RepID=UPI002C6961CF|nr:ABC-F family ATP-binding cassette domain-containing protein [Desulfitobacterium sp.]HVJ49312.1 ABC-F family ATP-binding cassette domain-containing protein [Desulfitobacterium sp.]
MSILYCRNCGVDVSGEALFRQVTFGIEPGEKVGLVGPNGAGKTTLLRACLGELRLESGQVQITGTYGYLPQNPLLAETGTVWDSMLEERAEIIQMREQMKVLEERMAVDSEEKVFEQYSTLTESYERSGGYALEAQIRKILFGLGLEKETKTPVERLSGGQKTRLALSKLLLSAPELLVLDEPTNHLDMEALEWLESFLRGYAGAILMVSHDRYFLDRVVQKILHLENGEMKTYTGNYSEYELQRAVEATTLARETEKLNTKISRLEEYIRRNKAGVNARQARGREIQLNKLKPNQTSKSSKEVHFNFQTGARSGDKVLMLEAVGIRFSERTLFSNVHLDLRRGDRVALLGKNGVGKTSLLKAISQQVPYQGEIRLGAKVQLGYYSQEHEDLHLTGTIIDEIRSDSALKDPEIRNLLARFGFIGEEVFKPVSVLSGGEKSRLELAKLFLAQGNLLLLDEPTNHLDTQMRDVLEEALADYEGTLLVVSHDRYFLDRVVNKIAHLTPSGLQVYEGDYSEYKAQVQEEETKDSATVDAGNSSSMSSSASERGIRDREAQKKQKRVQSLEKQIAEQETQLQEIESKLAQTAANYERAMELQQEYDTMKENLDSTMTEWLELTEELS